MGPSSHRWSIRRSLCSQFPLHACETWRKQRRLTLKWCTIRLSWLTVHRWWSIHLLVRICVHRLVSIWILWYHHRCWSIVVLHLVTESKLPVSWGSESDGCCICLSHGRWGRSESTGSRERSRAESCSVLSLLSPAHTHDAHDDDDKAKDCSDRDASNSSSLERRANRIATTGLQLISSCAYCA